MDEEIPDINKIDEIVASIESLPVIGGYTRSLSIGPDGEWEPDRYIEKLGDFCSEFAIRTAVERMFKSSVYVNGINGVITAQSRERLTVTFDDGTEVEYIATKPPPDKIEKDDA